jgi:hypothetical protein
MATKIRSKWRKSVRYESVPTSATLSSDTSFTVSEAVSAPISEPVSVAPTPTSSGDSVTIFRPGGTQEKLVDEVANDTLLASHPDVLSYINPSTLDLRVGGPYTGISSGFYTTQKEWPTNYGHDNSTVQQETAIHNLWSYRSHSPYQSDHYLAGYAGSPSHRVYGTSGDGQTWINQYKFCRRDTPLNNTNHKTYASYMGVNDELITDVYFRYAIYLESSIISGMTEAGCKLATVACDNIGSAFSLWFQKFIPGEDGFRLQCYWTGSNDRGSWGTGDWSGENGHGGNWDNGAANVFLVPDTWHWLEGHFKLNTDASTANGIREYWFDDELILRHLNCKNHLYTGVNPIEIRYIRDQFFHGGLSATPSQIIWARTAGWCFARRRIGPAKA